MWICPKCKEELEDTFDTCWQCGTSMDGITTPYPEEFEEQVVSTQRPQTLVRAYAPIELDPHQVATQGSRSLGKIKCAYCGFENFPQTIACQQCQNPLSLQSPHPPQSTTSTTKSRSSQPNTSPSWEYLFVEFALKIGDGWYLWSINHQPVKHEWNNLSLSEYSATLGDQGWGLVSTIETVAHKDKRWISLGELFRGDTRDPIPVLFLSFKRRK